MNGSRAKWNMTGSNKLWLTAIFAAALLMRGLYACQTGDLLKWHDEKVYDDIAWNLTQGHGYSITEADGTHRLTMYRPPAQSFLLALVYLLFGHNILLAKILQAALGALTCVITYFIAREVTGQASAGLLAAAGVALYPTYVYCAATLHPITLMAFLLALSFLFTLQAKSGRHPMLSAAIAGVGLGMSGLATAYQLLVALFSSLWILGLKTDQWRRTVAPAAAILVAAILVIAPWVMRNYALFRQPTVSANFGFNLWEGNVPAKITHGGRFYIPRDYSRPHIATRSEKVADAIFRNLAMKAIRGDPARYARLAFGRFICFWDSHPKNPKTSGRRLSRPVGLMLDIYVWGFYILSLVGLILLRSLRSFYALLALYFAPTFFTVVLVQCTTRYRFPLDVLLISAAACAIALIPRRWRLTALGVILRSWIWKTRRTSP